VVVSSGLTGTGREGSFVRFIFSSDRFVRSGEQVGRVAHLRRKVHVGSMIGMSITEGRADAPARRARGFWPLVAVAVGVAALVLGVVLGRAWTRAGESLVVQSTPSVVVAVRDLARLEGAEFRIDRVISLTDEQEQLFGLVKAKDAILLVASGSVVAGVDLSGLTDADVVIDPVGHKVRLRLPSSEILSSRLDADHTFVYQRDTDLLARRKESLETQARQEAERTLAKAAAEGGIVERSNASVRRTVETLLRSLGFSDVEVVLRGPPSATTPR
jgi:hypothetical protein